jgi:hypothetical protein
MVFKVLETPTLGGFSDNMVNRYQQVTFLEKTDTAPVDPAPRQTNDGNDVQTHARCHRIVGHTPKPATDCFRMMYCGFPAILIRSRKRWQHFSAGVDGL